MSTTGRTTWWPCDAAEHDRELIVELGEEFGPAGPYAMRVLKDLAQQQRDGGRVRTGYRVLRQKTFVADLDTVRQIIDRAAAIGALDDLAVDDDGRRFACRISGWEADQARGREAIKKAGQRLAAKEDTSQDERTTRPVVPLRGDVSGFVPPTRPDQTIEEPPKPPKGGRTRDRELYEDALSDWTQRHLPGADPKRVAALAGFLQDRIAPLTADALSEYAAAHPVWALQEEPARA